MDWFVSGMGCRWRLAESCRYHGLDATLCWYPDRPRQNDMLHSARLPPLQCTSQPHLP